MQTKNTLIIVGAVILFLTIVGTVYVWVMPQNQRPQTAAETNAPEASISPLVDTEIDPADDTLLAGGSSYLDPKGVFSLLYPNDYVLDTQSTSPNGPMVRFYKRGEQQRPQSEMSDGVIVVIETVSLDGQSLEQWVDEQLKTQAEGGVSEVVAPKRPVLWNTYPGFTYQFRGLGESAVIALQKDLNSDTAVVITYLVADPQNQNYQAEVDSMLRTIQIHK